MYMSCTVESMERSPQQPNLKLEKVCRVCLEESDVMHSVFSELAHEDNLTESSFIYDMLMSISSMKVLTNDGLPTMICTRCLELAHTSYKFQQKCNQSQVILEAYLAQITVISPIEEPLSKELDSFGVLLDMTPTDEVDVIPKEISNDLDLLESSVSMLDDPLSADCCDLEDKSDDGIKKKKKLKLKKDEDSEKKGVDDCHNYGYYVQVNDDGEKVYACNLCDKTYKFSSSLKVHMATHTEERRYVCNLCKKAFKQYTSLTYHLRSHSGVQPYSCKICGKRYRQSGTLTAHMRVHTGHRPYLCSICGKGFRQRPDLNYHMRTHTKEKPYMCNVCGKTMAMQCHLVQHMRTHTGERPYKCEHCNKAFPSSTRLKRHAIIHTGLKPYKCEVCEKSFNRASSLKVHAKIHTDERPHQCPVCEKRFIQAHTLKSHILTHSTSTSA